MGFMSCFRGVICDVAHWFNLRHYQGLCLFIIVASIGALTNEGPQGSSSRRYFYGMIHIGSFAACLGAQLWVILVAGMTMFFILPRHIFGKLQTFMFPMFFLWCLASSGLALSTYTSLHPLPSWDKTHCIQIVCLLVTLTTSSINSIVLSPIIIESMVKTFQYEVEVGAGHIVGHAVVKELLENPDYIRSYSKFRRCHSASAILNVISLLANFVYLHYLVSRIVQSVD